MTICDSHCHFFSSRFLEALGRERYGTDTCGDAERVAQELSWDAPGSPAELADRWMDEVRRHKLSRVALISSAPGDEDSVSVAVARHPDHLVGFFMLNAGAPDAVERATRGFTDLGLRCACLFPAMHRYRIDDDRVAAVFEVAAAHGGAVFVHCGYLSVGARVKLGLRSLFDLRLGDPLAVAAMAVRYPTVPVIIPHFGAGFFREALMAAEVCPSIHLDTSSSNGWMKYVPGLTLAEVFRRALMVVGPDRLIFGTDSSFFPRGWHRVIYGAQHTALDELGVEPDAVAKIFGGNFERIFPPRQRASDAHR